MANNQNLWYWSFNGAFTLWLEKHKWKTSDPFLFSIKILLNGIMNIHAFGLLPNKNKRSQMKQEKIKSSSLSCTKVWRTRFHVLRHVHLFKKREREKKKKTYNHQSTKKCQHLHQRFFHFISFFTDFAMCVMSEDKLSHCLCNIFL